MGGRVHLGELGPVALPVEDQPLDAEPVADRVEVLRGLPRRVAGDGRRVDPGFPDAGVGEDPGGVGARRRGRVADARSRAVAPLGRADAALVEEQDVPPPDELLVQPLDRLDRGVHAAAARTSDRDRQRAEGSHGRAVDGVHDPDRCVRSTLVVDRDEHSVAGEGGLGTGDEPWLGSGRGDEDAGSEQQDRRQDPNERPARGIDERDEHAEGAGGSRLAPEHRVEGDTDQHGCDEPQGTIDPADHAQQPRRVGVPGGPEPDRGDEAHDRGQDDDRGSQPGHPPAGSDPEVRPPGPVCGHARRPPEQRQPADDPRSRRRAVDDAALPQLLHHGQGAAQPPYGQEDADDHDDDQDGPGRVEGCSGGFDLLGRDEIPVDGDEESRLADRDEAEDEAREGGDPGQPDDPPAADEVAPDAGLELVRDGRARIPARRDRRRPRRRDAGRRIGPAHDVGGAGRGRSGIRGRGGIRLAGIGRAGVGCAGRRFERRFGGRLLVSRDGALVSSPFRMVVRRLRHVPPGRVNVRRGRRSPRRPCGAPRSPCRRRGRALPRTCRAWP